MSRLYFLLMLCLLSSRGRSSSRAAAAVGLFGGLWSASGLCVGPPWGIFPLWQQQWVQLRPWESLSAGDWVTLLGRSSACFYQLWSRTRSRSRLSKDCCRSAGGGPPRPPQQVRERGGGSAGARWRCSANLAKKEPWVIVLFLSSRRASATFVWRGAALEAATTLQFGARRSRSSTD